MAASEFIPGAQAGCHRIKLTRRYLTRRPSGRPIGLPLFRLGYSLAIACLRGITPSPHFLFEGVQPAGVPPTRREPAD